VDWSHVAEPQFWLTVSEIILINILLSGDNAILIALACRRLPPRERMFGMVIGAGAASVLLIVFTGIVAFLMRLPYLQLVGGCLLFWVAVRLLIPEEEHAEGTVEAVEDLWRAVRIVVVADIVMSLDNVVAVAAAAKGNYLLLGLGLCVSIPVVIAGAALIMALLDRFPILVWAGAALLGWIAGDMLAGDAAVLPYLSAPATLTLDVNSNLLGLLGRHRLEIELDLVQAAAGALGALGVLLVGRTLRRARLAPKTGISGLPPASRAVEDQA